MTDNEAVAQVDKEALAHLAYEVYVAHVLDHPGDHEGGFRVVAKRVVTRLAEEGHLRRRPRHFVKYTRDRR